MQYFVCKNLISRGLKRSSEKWEEGRKIGRNKILINKRELRPKKIYNLLTHAHAHTHTHNIETKKIFLVKNFLLQKFFSLFLFQLLQQSTTKTNNQDLIILPFYFWLIFCFILFLFLFLLLASFFVFIYYSIKF